MVNAGFEIIAEAKMDSRRNPGSIDGVALGQRTTEFGPEWVTWEWVEYPGEERRFFWGHYLRDETMARKDFCDRVLKVFYKFV